MHRETTPLRRSLAAVSAVSLAAGLAACGSSGSSSGGAGTLKIITWVNPPAVTAITKIDAEFHQKYPKIKVQLQTAANVNGPYAALQETSVDSGTADIVTNVLPVQPMPLSPTRSRESNFQYWSTNGVFQPLNGQPFLKDLTPDAVSVETYKGQTDALESGSYQEGVFYNKATFARYHLSVPTTYSQFLVLCATLKAHGVTPLYDGLGDVGPAYLQFLYWPLMADLWYPWDLASVHQANPGLQVGFFPLPGSNTARDNQPFLKGDLAFAVLKNAPDKAAAMKWLAFFATSKIYDQYVDITGISPSEKTGTYDNFSASVLGDWFGRGVNQDVAYPALPTSGAYWDEVTNWPVPQLDVIQGKMTPQQAEARYQSGWQTG